jgi:hypothetical protein
MGGTVQLHFAISADGFSLNIFYLALEIAFSIPKTILPPIFAVSSN